MTKPNFSRKEARWLELFAQFCISNLSLRPGQIHVLGYMLSHAPHVMSESLEIGNFSLSRANLKLYFENNYLKDQLLGPTTNYINGIIPSDGVQIDRISRLLSAFQVRNNLLYYKDLICVPRRNVRDLLHLAHDCKVSGNFAFAKTLGRLFKYHWEHKARNVKQYFHGCIVSQQNKDGDQKLIGVSQPLEALTRRWESVSTYFIVQFTRTLREFDAISTWVYRLSHIVHLISFSASDTASESPKIFLKTSSSTMDSPTTSSVTEIPNSHPVFGQNYYLCVELRILCQLVIISKLMGSPNS